MSEFLKTGNDINGHGALQSGSRINGASNVVGEIFGDKGAHSRFAVGVGSLPFNVAVEVEAVFEVE